MFDALVLAGGGCRCFWQVGFLDALRQHHELTPKHVSCVSAGSAMAAMIFSKSIERGIATFERFTADNAKNAYWANLLTAAPVFPHMQMYGDALRIALDETAIAELAAAPPIDVLVARPPEPLPPAAALTVGFAAYMLERQLHGRVHPSWPRQLGYRPELFRVQDVMGQHKGDAKAAAEAVIELVLASSCTPPFTPLLRYRGEIALDGGLIDNVPTFAAPADAQRVLVLLTRTYPPGKLTAQNGETIVQPSQPIPVSKWDYTRPDLLRETFELGRKDGEAFGRQQLN